ncbi:MAG: hypothetical protein ACLPZR_05375, partial [Solirubrobacteraceae bacterium]
MSPGSSIRRQISTGIIAVLASLAFAASAQAAVTQSTISSPADPFFGFDQQQTQNVTVSGTSNGTTGDSVDIDCYTDNGSAGTRSARVVPNLPVAANGSFSTSLPLIQLTGLTSVDDCRLRAVAAGSSPTTGLSAYAGPRTLVGSLSRATVGTPGPYDFYINAPQLGVANDYSSFGNCGLDDSYITDPSVFGQVDSKGFYCNDWVDNPAISDGSRPGLVVDSHPAYAPNNAHLINPNASGAPTFTIVSITQNPSDGNLTVVEQEQLARCAGDPFPANSMNCTAFIPSGIAMKRTITQFDNGHIVHFQDVYTSTDGSAHTVSLLLEQNNKFGGQQLAYEFPGESTFAAHSGGDQVTATGNAPESILIKNTVVADGSPLGGAGAITYDQAPSGPSAFDSGNDFDISSQVAVPATGSATIGYTYSTETTMAAAQTDALTAADIAQPPSATITSPADGTTAATSPQTVTGTAGAGSGVASVTVNGVAATVAPDGTWTVSIPLTAGANAIHVVVTSVAGRITTADETITFASSASEPGAPVKVEPPRITGHIRVDGKLDCRRGEWADQPTGFHYQWSRDGVAIPGATSRTFTIALRDQGHDLTCTTTAENADGSATSISPAVDVPIASSAACPAPRGALSGLRLGPVSLGEARDTVRARLPSYNLKALYTDDLCLSTGLGIRVGYGSAQTLGNHAARSGLMGRVLLALTANQFYALDGVRPGERTASVRRRLG